MEKWRLVRVLAWFAWCLVVVAVPSCAAPDGGAGDGAVARVSGTIGSAGGVLELPDGGRLMVPPGALGSNTAIEVSVPAAGLGVPAGRAYLLEPAGLEFLAPAVLTIPWPDGLEALTDVLPFTVYQASTRHDPIDAGSELSVVRAARVTAVDATARTLDVELDHFTFVYGMMAIDQTAYVVMDIPPKFLLPGDLFFTLTNTGAGPNWAPGHVGMFVPRQGFSRDVPNGRIVEATPPKVQASTLADFRTESGHLFMGPRRPAGGLDASQRTTVTAFAEAQMNKPYAMILGQGNLTSGSFSCVGLVETALEAADRGVLSIVQEALIATPLEAFSNTEPVRDIVLYVGEKVEVPIYGVVVDPASFQSRLFGRGSWGWYCACSYDMAAAVPAGATFTGPTPLGNTYPHHQRYLFAWVPEVQHANQTFNVPIQMFGYLRRSGGTLIDTRILLEELRITVLPLSGATVATLMLANDLADGLFPVGDYALSRVTSGRVVTGEMGCDGGAPHLHADGEGIFIDGVGPLPDPDPTGCGYGTIVQVPVEHLR